MKITEPATMLTDYLLATASLVFTVQLWRLGRSRGGGPVFLWACAFAAMAAAGVLGGTFHGFTLALAEPTRHSLWNATLYCIGLGSGFMIAGAMAASIPWRSEAARWLMAAVGFSVFGLGIQQAGIGLHESFNHNDIYHCIQTGALYLFYRGARLC